MIQMTRPLRLMRIGNDTNDEVVEVEDRGTQGPKGLEHLIRELELDK